ncbi:hypothetical protein pb186bvf_000867 [Paramecium bursaria]
MQPCTIKTYQQLDFEDLYYFKENLQPFQLQLIMESFNIKDIINNDQALKIYNSLVNVQQNRCLSSQEQSILNWLLMKLYAIKPFQLDYIPQHVWQKISQILRRPLSSLRKMRQRIQRFNLNKFPWVKEEDEILFNIVRYSQTVDGQIKSNKQIRWNNVSEELRLCTKSQHIRSPRQCRERWINNLNPKLNKMPWTQYELKILMEEVEQVGRQWALIAKKLNRNEHMVKNKYNSIKRQEQISQKLFHKQRQIWINEGDQLIQQNDTPDLDLYYEFAFANMKTKEIFLCDRHNSYN